MLNFFNKASRLACVFFLIFPYPVYANETTTTTTSTTTTTTTTIPGEVLEVETFDGPEETTTTTTTTTILQNNNTTTTTTTTTTTIPEWEQSTDIELPEDQINIQGNEIENNIHIDDTHSNGNWKCCNMTDFHMNLHYQQHGNDSNDYTFTLPDTTTINEEQLNIEIYEVGFTIGALNNDGSVTYTHNDETTQQNILEGQSNSNLNTMYETVIYNVRETLDTFIDSFTISINDWSLLDDISFKYISPTTTTTTTTTTTLPPMPDPEPYVQPLPPEPEIIVIILDSGEEAEYEQHEIDDGTVERDNERQKNLQIYGVELTDEQIERGDLEFYEIQNNDLEEIGEEFFNDDFIYDDMENEYYDQEYIELTTDEIIALEKQMDLEARELELEQEIEFFEFETEEDAEEFIKTMLELEESNFEEEFAIENEIFEIDIIEFDNELIITEEEIKNELGKKIPGNELNTENEFQDEEIFVEPIQENFKEEIEIIEITEEEILLEVNEAEQTIKEIVNVEEITKIKSVEDLEELTENEINEYKEEVEAAIIEYVEELPQEKQIEVIEEIALVGVNNLDKATEETKQVVQAVVNEVTKIESVETLSVEQTEIVAEVLGFDEVEDVAIIAEAAAKEENIAQAVDEYVERASDNANVENYNLSDVVVEIAVENFIADPISIIQIDFNEITINNISSDMTSSQKEKAQEVVVPVILARIATIGSFIMRKSF